MSTALSDFSDEPITVTDLDVRPCKAIYNLRPRTSQDGEVERIVLHRKIGVSTGTAEFRGDRAWRAADLMLRAWAEDSTDDPSVEFTVRFHDGFSYVGHISLCALRPLAVHCVDPVVFAASHCSNASQGECSALLKLFLANYSLT